MAGAAGALGAGSFGGSGPILAKDGDAVLPVAAAAEGDDDDVEGAVFDDEEDEGEEDGAEDG